MGKRILINSSEGRKTVRTAVPNLCQGDEVLVHADYVIEVVKKA